MIKYTILIIIISLMLISCKDPLGVTGSIDNAVKVIEQGIEDITQESASWQSVLQQVANQLPDDVREIIGNEAQNLATRSIASTGVEFRCNVDFFGNRAIASLKRLKNKLLGKNAKPLPPAFCQVSPDAIDLKVSPNAWTKITLHGYDLDHKDSNGNTFRVLSKTANSTQALTEDRIGRTTHYQVTVNMGDMARTLHAQSISKILVSWDESKHGYPEVVVLPWEAKTKDKIEHFGKTTIMPKKIGSGDRNFNTHNDEHMSIDVRGELDIKPRYINSRMYMQAREERHDWTEVKEWSDWKRAYTAPQGWKIVSVNPKHNSRHTSNIISHGHHFYNRPAGEVVSKFEVWGDHDGDEAGTWTKLYVFWNPITITLKETEPNWMQ